jgi:hypothetical protein
MSSLQQFKCHGCKSLYGLRRGASQRTRRERSRTGRKQDAGCLWRFRRRWRRISAAHPPGSGSGSSAKQTQRRQIRSFKRRIITKECPLQIPFAGGTDVLHQKQEWRGTRRYTGLEY